MNTPTTIHLSTEEVEEDDEQVESELEHKEEEAEPPTLKNPPGYYDGILQQSKVAHFKSINGFW
jgi:hypothetical protein